MKRLICIALSVLFMGSLFAQEKFPVPDVTLEKKNSIILANMYGMITSGISFAKSQGVSPHDYGMYVGNIFVHSWNPDIGFDGFVKGVIRSWESFKTDQDGTIRITENPDHSVTMEFPKIAMTKYLGKDSHHATIDEAVECFTGMLKPFGTTFNCAVTIDVTDTYLVFNFSENK